MLGSFIPLNEMAHIIDKYFRKGLKGINEVVVTLLLFLKDELMET